MSQQSMWYNFVLDTHINLEHRGPSLIFFVRTVLKVDVHYFQNARRERRTLQPGGGVFVMLTDQCMLWVESKNLPAPSRVLTVRRCLRLAQCLLTLVQSTNVHALSTCLQCHTHVCPCPLSRPPQLSSLVFHSPGYTLLLRSN